MSVDIVYHASKGHLFNVKRLLEHGILPDATAGNGETALFHAALGGHLDVVTTLLKYGADPNRCSINGLSPVNAACIKDNIQSLAALLFHGGRLEHPSFSESAVVTAHRYRSRRVKLYIRKIKEHALLNFTGDAMDVIDEVKNLHEDTDEDKSITDDFQPGSCSSVPLIDADQLTTLHEGVRFSFIAPCGTFRNACWNRIAVTVKTSNRKKDMQKDLEILCNLRHPRVAMILAGVSSPNTGLTSLVFDYFKLGNLHHVLYVSRNLDLSLVQRITILFDISKAMEYVHKKRILHCYINPYSVLVDGDLRAKIGNFEHAQYIDEDTSEGTSINHIGEQHPWMAPGQLNGEPANKNSDRYSFGAVLWECLATKQPWSWMTGKSTFQALCEEYLRLPILQDWPGSLKKVLTECTGPEQERSDFDTITQHLNIIRTSDLQVPGKILESAFEMWLTGEHKITPRRKSSGPRVLFSKMSRNISALRMDSESEEEEDDAKIRLLKTRRRSSLLGLSQRRNTIHQGVMNVMNALHLSANKKDLRKQNDTEKYGLEVAEELATVRNLWKTAKHHVRHRWAKEMYIRRKLEGDIKRIKMSKRFKEGRGDLKARQAQKGQRVRRLSHGEESITRLRTIAGKYEKWDWARYTTGHKYHPPEDKYELSEGDKDEGIEEETVIVRDVIKEAYSSCLQLVTLEDEVLTDSNKEDAEQQESSIDENSDNGIRVEMVGDNEEGEALRLSNKHENQLQVDHEGRDKQHQAHDDENDDVNHVSATKEGKEEDEDKEEEEEIEEEGGGEAVKESGRGRVDGEEEKENEEENKEEDQEAVKGGGDEDKEEDNGGGDLQNNKDDINISCEHEHDDDPADKSLDSDSQHNIVEIISESPDTNGNEASNEGVKAKAKCSSYNLRTEGITKETSKLSEDGEATSGKVSVSTDAVNILDEFSQWLDEYCEGVSSTSDFEEDVEKSRDLNEVLGCDDSSRDVTPENDQQQSASQETLLDEEVEYPSENGCRTDDQPITAKLPSDEESEKAQPSTSGINFHGNK